MKQENSVINIFSEKNFSDEIDEIWRGKWKEGMGKGKWP